MSFILGLKISQEFYFILLFHSCDFNKYTMRVIRKMSQAKLKDKIEKASNDDDEEMLLIKSEEANESDSDEKMSDDETSEE